ncbi:MAG: hypothetical protein HC828_12470 [Blastochloris sp.]|nr:hypothetical protein [Blastochloris sp.]
MTANKPQNTTIIDTISQGYIAINRRPWLLILPILLNVFLLYGAQISLGPLAAQYAAATQSLRPAGEAGAEFDQLLLDVAHADIRLQLAFFNCIPSYAAYTLSYIGAACNPTGLSVVQPLPPSITSQRGSVLQMSSIADAALLIVFINAVMLPLSAAFLSQIAEAVRNDQASLVTRLRRTGHATLSMLGYIAIIGGIGLLLGLPFLFLVGLLAAVNPALAGLGASLIVIVSFWVSVYTGFAREAIVVSGVGPLRAIHASFNIVRQNFWGTLGFLVLAFIITVGAGLIWQTLATSTAGLIAAIAGSAYIGSGLWAARMAFYHERLRRWQAAMPVVRSSA